MIELRGLERVFTVGGRPVHALRPLDLTLGAGEYVSVMGPSGSGKSTLLQILGCLDRPSAGSYRLRGKEVTELDEVELSRIRGHEIGFVFQTFHLIGRLTALGNVELPMVFAGRDRRERLAKARSALMRVGLGERAEHRPQQLSGGERQRVAIARAVVMGPSILLADEPTGNLDAAASSEIVALLEEMNQAGLTLVVVTHDPDLGARAGRRLRLADGALVKDERGPSPAAGPAGGPGARVAGRA